MQIKIYILFRGGAEEAQLQAVASDIKRWYKADWDVWPAQWNRLSLLPVDQSELSKIYAFHHAGKPLSLSPVELSEDQLKDADFIVQSDSTFPAGSGA